jgi:hypothetical protein
VGPFSDVFLRSVERIDVRPPAESIPIGKRVV